MLSISLLYTRQESAKRKKKRAYPISIDVHGESVREHLVAGDDILVEQHFDCLLGRVGRNETEREADNEESQKAEVKRARLSGSWVFEG